MNNALQRHNFSKEWRWARFDEFLQRIERKVTIDDLSFYNCVGVRWYGMGAFVRENLPGINIARKQQWQIKSGDVVYNKLFAWKSAFAIADDAVDDCIVSDKFPTYQLDTAIANPQFLHYYFRTMDVAQQALALSKGGAAISKLTLNPPQFWDLAAPLPPLEEQQRIVARIEELVAKIEKAQNLHQEAVSKAMALSDSVIATILTALPKAEIMSVEDIAEVRGGIQKSPNRLPGDNPVRYLTVAHVHRDYITLEDPRFFEVSPAELKLWKLESGDVLVIEGNGSADQIGRAALFRGEIDQCVHQNHVIRVRPDQKRIYPEFLNIYFNSPVGKEEIQSQSRTTSGLRTLSVGRIKQINVIVPSLSTQRQIITSLNDLQLKVNILKQRQAKTSAKLNAMLPSILDKAFKGEL